MHNKRLRFISYSVIVYMLLAFTWWTVLLFIKNEDSFNSRAAYMKIIMVAEQRVKNQAEFFQTPEYKELQQNYERQKWMVLGEAGVFVISLMIGIWLINRSYYKEIKAAGQMRNFLLSITHELKSPLSSVRLVLETIQKRKNLEYEQIAKICGNGLIETDRLNSLVNDLLLAARVESAYQPHFDWIPLERFLGDIIEKKKINWPTAQISIDFEPQGTLVKADPLGLQAIIVNLLENAVKYSPGQPRVLVKIVSDCDKKRIRITVADEGIGIKDAEKKLIFDKFYRVGNENTRRTKGTGLGLYIVNQFVRLHKGSIHVKDNEPEGTVFIVDLPLEIAVEEPVPETNEKNA